MNVLDGAGLFDRPQMGQSNNSAPAGLYGIPSKYSAPMYTAGSASGEEESA